MARFTLTELRKIVESCFQDDGAVLDEANLDTLLEDLGYDSLAVVDLVVRIQDEYGVRIGDSELPELTTPRAIISYMDARLPAPSGG